jgi:hypothetical protein
MASCSWDWPELSLRNQKPLRTFLLVNLGGDCHDIHLLHQKDHPTPTHGNLDLRDVEAQPSSGIFIRRIRPSGALRWRDLAQ